MCLDGAAGGGGGANITRQPSIQGGRITDAGVELRPKRKRAGRTKLERQSTLIRQKVESDRRSSLFQRFFPSSYWASHWYNPLPQ